MTQEELIELISERVRKSGSQASLAKELGIAASYLNDVLHGKREPGKQILEAFGLERSVTYVKKSSAKK